MAKKDGNKGRPRSERFEVDDVMSAADVAGYLEAVAKGLREGNVALGEQGESFSVPVTGDVDFEVEAKHGKRKSRIELTLRFRQEKTAEPGPDEASTPEGDSSREATIPDEMSF